MLRMFLVKSLLTVSTTVNKELTRNAGFLVNSLLSLAVFAKMTWKGFGAVVLTRKVPC